MSDAFELLGVEPAFELDLSGLERRHRELSRTLHPDRYVGRPPAERRQALGKAIEVNEAWRVLRDPVRRAEALLTKLGLQVGEQPEPPTDQELLMEMMEWREELADARRGRDPKALHKLVEAVRARQGALIERMAAGFAEALANGSGPPADAASRRALLQGLGELRYFRKFLDDAAVIEDELF